MNQNFTVTEMVPASSIWPKAKTVEDQGPVVGLVRGYNVEVVKNGKVDWMSCVWIRTSIEEYVNDEYTRYWYMDCGVTPTGRVSFRGYGVERYDPAERDTYIEEVTL